MGRLTDYFAFLNAEPKDLQLVKFNLSHLEITPELMKERRKHLSRKRKESKEKST